jgi:hypothetical protein
MGLVDRLIEMEVQRQVELRQQIEMLESGRLTVGERRPGTPGMIDLTQESLERCRRHLAESEAMLPRLREKAATWK